MAAGVLPTPGKMVGGIEIGPCISECQHTDCAGIRQDAASICRLCGQPIGYGTRFYHDRDSGAGKLVHAVCRVLIDHLLRTPLAAQQPPAARVGFEAIMDHYGRREREAEECEAEDAMIADAATREVLASQVAAILAEIQAARDAELLRWAREYGVEIPR